MNWLIRLGLLATILAAPGRARALEVEASVGSIMAFRTSRCCSWSLRIAADGSVTTTLSPADHLSRRFALSQKQMAELETLLTREDFLSLDRELGQMVIDGPEAQIRVKLGTREQTVILRSLPPELLPMWRTTPTQLGRAFRICEQLRSIVGVPQAFHCPGIRDDQ